MIEAAVWRFEAIGTHWTISSPEPLSARVAGRITERIEAYDRTYSRFRSDSLVSQLARCGGSAEFPDDAPPLFDLYSRLEKLTKGSVTPLVGSSLEQLGYDADYTLQPHGGARPAPSLEKTLRVSGQTVTLSERTMIDVGAAGKGQLVDLVAELLLESGVSGATVDGSGDIRYDGSDSLSVALEHPYDPEQAIGVAQLAGPRRRAIAGSSTRRRTWDDPTAVTGHGSLHHVIDGLTGEPVRTVTATWAIAPSAMLADALATALFFVPGSIAAREFDFDFDWVRVFTDGRLEYSESLKEGMFQ
jgi:thiamine biosynthesis lipoprotein